MKENDLKFQLIFDKISWITVDPEMLSIDVKLQVREGKKEGEREGEWERVCKGESKIDWERERKKMGERRGEWQRQTDRWERERQRHRERESVCDCKYSNWFDISLHTTAVCLNSLSKLYRGRE